MTVLDDCRARLAALTAQRDQAEAERRAREQLVYIVSGRILELQDVIHHLEAAATPEPVVGPAEEASHAAA